MIIAMVRSYQACTVPNLGVRPISVVRELFNIFPTNVLVRRHFIFRGLKLRHSTVIRGEMSGREGGATVCHKRKDSGQVINGHISFQQRQMCPHPDAMKVFGKQS